MFKKMFPDAALHLDRQFNPPPPVAAYTPMIVPLQQWQNWQQWNSHLSAQYRLFPVQTMTVHPAPNLAAGSHTCGVRGESAERYRNNSVLDRCVDASNTDPVRRASFNVISPFDVPEPAAKRARSIP